MPLLRQLELDFTAQKDYLLATAVAGRISKAVAGQARRPPTQKMVSGAPALQSISGRDHILESLADSLLRSNGAAAIASQVRVEWNPRLKTCAGRANYRARLITLNPLLHEHGTEEIHRTFLHELAHLLAQFRSGRRRILPHGNEWRRACHELGIGDEKRCHNLPFPVSQRSRRLLYRCPNCRRDFPRVRRLRRAIACLACCRAHNRGRFDKRFQLRLLKL